MLRLYLGSVNKKSKMKRLMMEEKSEGPMPKRRALAMVAIK